MSLTALVRWLRRGPSRAAVPPAPTVAPTAPVDLAGIRSLEVADVELRHPVSGELLGARVTLAAPDHPARRQAKLDIARAERERGAPEGDEASIERIDAAALELLSRIVLGWQGIRQEGADIPWSPQAVRDLLAPEAMRWLRNQLLDEAGRLENFIGTSATA